ncbi:MAG: GTPase Der [Myxococcota bacterium]|nr:GTPase Der [Myxococcota bacterium]
MEHHSAKSQASQDPKLILAGNPNVGKSVFFGALTGNYVTVSNYPGTTVEVTRGAATLDGRRWEVIDTPGTNNLVPMSEDERVTRDVLLHSPGATLLQVADAKNLRRGLLLTVQIIELGLPSVLNLNMIDEAEDRGIFIDLDGLSAALGIPVNASVAIRREGLDAARQKVMAPRRGDFRVEYPASVERAIERIASHLPPEPFRARGLAVLALCGDTELDAWFEQQGFRQALEAVRDERERLNAELNGGVFVAINMARLRVVEQLVERYWRKHAPAHGLQRGAPGRRADILTALFSSAIALLAGVAADGALGVLSAMWAEHPEAAARRTLADPLDEINTAHVLSRIASGDLFQHAGAGVGFLVMAVAGWLMIRSQRSAAAGLAKYWMLLALAYLVFFAAYFPAKLAGWHGPWNIWLFLLTFAALLIAGWRAGGERDAEVTGRIGRWATHPAAGFALLAGVLIIVYKVVGEFGAGTAVDFLENTIFASYITPGMYHALAWLLPAGPVENLIIGPPRDDLSTGGGLLIGQYGLVSMGLSYAIAIVLPIVGVFFIAFSIMEDSGYLPRLAVMVNRLFRLMGLNGKAVLPMVLGLGCDTMATMTARIMETKKERLIVTLLLALGVPCSAQLGVILGMLAGLSLAHTLWWVGTIVLVMIAVGWLAARLLPGESSDFLLELPPIRRPQLSNIIVKTVARIEWYLKEAAPLFVLGTFILWVMDAVNALAVVQRIGEPVVTGWLGLPAQAAEAFLIGFLRRDFGAAGLFDMSNRGMMDPRQVVVAMVTITLFVPCIANFFMIVKERGLKTGVAMTAFIFPFAFGVGGVIYRLMGWLA